jgi:hypothetical protein
VFVYETAHNSVKKFSFCEIFVSSEATGELCRHLEKRRAQAAAARLRGASTSETGLAEE